MNLNNVILIGRTTAVPECRFTQNGLGITRFTIAVGRDYKDKKTGNYETDFLPCVVFGKSTEWVTDNIGKGQLIAVSGRIQTGSYEKDGEKRKSYDIVCARVKLLERKKRGDAYEPETGFDDTVPF